MLLRAFRSKYFNIFLFVIQVLFTFFYAVSIFSYTSTDRSASVFSDGKILNKFGAFGAFTSDIFFQYFGLLTYFFLVNLLCWAILKCLDFDIKLKKYWVSFLIAALGIDAVLASFASYKFYFEFFIGGYLGEFFYKKFINGEYLSYILIGFYIITPLIYLYSTGFLRIILNLLRYKKTHKSKGKKNTKSKAATPPEHATHQETDEKEKGYVPPSFDFLTLIKSSKTIEAKNIANVERLKLDLMQVLKDFGIKGEIVGINVGPLLTVFELEPDAGIRANRVIGLSDDIARYLKAISCRITIIPGKSSLGIEVPNKFRETVYLREILTSENFIDSSASLPITLGKTINNLPVVVDLAKMPHLLIAGTTGSGKSVGVNAMILSLLYKLSPKECRFLMIDPKMLELSVYEGIPHLLSPVITDPQKAVLALKWVTKEMENRYKLMSELGVRNIIGYNEALKDRGMRLPYIVVIVDEMADLMLTAGKSIEASIQRLAQMARASGIHIILATQRPSVDVITGVIKANFPIRVSYQVASSMDARTILGYQGSEKLLGQGDMLYMPTGGKTIRIHGPFVSDGEIAKVTEYLKQNYPTDYVEDIEEFTAEADGDLDDFSDPNTEGNDDKLYKTAVKIVLNDKKTSVSYLQRRLKIGYNKSANLIERMQNEGILSEPDHMGKRVIIQQN
jgi:S-DNA-T family DNA segregation ATPase FtsK/SpoIIIE